MCGSAAAISATLKHRPAYMHRDRPASRAAGPRSRRRRARSSSRRSRPRSRRPRRAPRATPRARSAAGRAARSNPPRPRGSARRPLPSRLLPRRRGLYAGTCCKAGGDVKEFRGRVAVVTGAASGIGRALATASRGKACGWCSPTSSRARSPRPSGELEPPAARRWRSRRTSRARTRSRRSRAARWTPSAPSTSCATTRASSRAGSAGRRRWPTTNGCSGSTSGA